MKYATLLGLPLSILATTAAAQMADCDYKAKFYGTTGTIQVTGGEPVGYYTPRYTASNVYMEGDTIFIDKATLSQVRIGKTKNGDWAIQGNWRLGSSTKKNVLFICK